jgi:hypothetical protein
MKQVLVGRTAMITVPFAETSVSLFGMIIPGVSVMVLSGSSAAKALLNTPVGSDLVASVARALLLTKSIGNTESTTPNDKFRFWKAAPTGRMEFGFDLENQRVYQVEFFAYPDANQEFSLGVFGSVSAVSAYNP